MRSNLNSSFGPKEEGRRRSDFEVNVGLSPCNVKRVGGVPDTNSSRQSKSTSILLCPRVRIGV